MTRLASFLQIRPGEARLVASAASLFALIEAGRGLGGNAADALFFLRFGVEYLPYMFMLLGAVNFLVSFTYAAGLGKFDKRRFFVALPIGLAVAILIERAAMALAPDAIGLYPALWITVNIISSILGLLAWNIASEVCDARQAKRLFSIFVSAGILGGVIGNFVTGPLAQMLGAQNLILIHAALLIACALVARSIIRQFFRPSAKSGAATSFLAEVRAGFDYVRASSMFKLMAIGSVLFSILYFSISFPFSQTVSANFPNEADVAGFLGVFSGAATAITFLVSLLGANRLYARIGVVNAVLLLPVAYFTGFVLFALDFSLIHAVVARLLQIVVLGGIAGTAYSTFFNVVSSDKRSQVRSFDSGVPEQIGVALSGVLLILGQRVLTPTQIFVIGMIGSIACGALMWRLRRLYGEALLGALRAGRYEVFTAGERAFAGFQSDANALRVIASALHDARPSTRRIAIELLARLQAGAAAPDIAQRLHDADRDVRLAAIRALGKLHADEAGDAVAALLTDDDAPVRAEALRALPDLIAHPPMATIENLLNDADAAVQMQAAIALSKFGQADRARPALDRLLRDPQVAVRSRTLEALGEAHAGFDLAPIAGALQDASPLVRRAACRTLEQLHDEAAIAPLTEHLNDADDSVREAAAQALRDFGRAATASIVRVLRLDDVRAQEAALDALTNDPAAAGPLQDYARREIDRLRSVLALHAAIPARGRATKLLREALGVRAAMCEQRLVKTIGLLGDRRAMQQVAEGLRSRKTESRAAAVEALETLGDKQLAKQIIPLLEETPSDGQTSAGAALDELIESGDAWLRALAMRAVPEAEVIELIPRLRAHTGDADAFIRAAAGDALIQIGEAKPMETLQTMSLMERVLLLHEVPLFAALSPDDLKQIAEIAREQWHADGSYLCREGEEGHETYVLATGQVRVTKGSKYLATRYAGDFIGEMAIIESRPRSSTVQADGEVRTLSIDGKRFKTILRDRPEVALAMLRGLMRRMLEKE